MFRTSSHTSEFSAIMCIFNLFLRLLTSWVLYWDWGDRRGLVAVTVTKNTEGGSVRSGSVLTHYPGEDHLRELNTVMMTRSDPAAAPIMRVISCSVNISPNEDIVAARSKKTMVILIIMIMNNWSLCSWQQL